VDHLGTPQMLTDRTGAIEWEASYRPFGEATVTVDESFTDAYNLRFPGQYFDAETGLHYNWFRDYDAALGRYLESDPIGLAGGWNTYAYVGGNPVMRVDPRGLLYCNYGISSQFLLCTNNAGEMVMLLGDEKVHSGQDKDQWRCRNNNTCGYVENYGPTPPGSYEIVPPPCSPTDPSWICIIPEDATEILNRKKFTFRIHPGHISAGCITISWSQKQAFDTIAQWAVEDGGGQLNVNP